MKADQRLGWRNNRNGNQGYNRHAEQVLGMRALDALQTWAKRTYRGADCESALDLITISDDAGECGNRRIGEACSAHLRNSRTDRMHMVSPKWG